MSVQQTFSSLKIEFPNNYLNFYMELNKLNEFNYQDSSYICSTALDIPFYFCACVGVDM